MAVYINRLNGGSITIGSGGSVLDATKTRFTLQDGTVETHNITGTLDKGWMVDNGYFDEEFGVWIKTITQVDIGNTVTSIGDYAFHSGELTSITIPDSVTSIGYEAFDYCSILANITIPDSVTSVGGWAFYYSTSLTSVTIPDSVTSIGESAFEGCEGLTSVTITANGGNANNVKQMIITAINNTGISDNITWNMPS